MPGFQDLKPEVQSELQKVANEFFNHIVKLHLLNTDIQVETEEGPRRFKGQLIVRVQSSSIKPIEDI